MPNTVHTVFQEGEPKEELLWFENIFENLFEENSDKTEHHMSESEPKPSLQTSTSGSGGFGIQNDSAAAITLKNLPTAQPTVDINVFEVRYKFANLFRCPVQKSKVSFERNIFIYKFLIYSQTPFTGCLCKNQRLTVNYILVFRLAFPRPRSQPHHRRRRDGSITTPIRTSSKGLPTHPQFLVRYPITCNLLNDYWKLL